MSRQVSPSNMPQPTPHMSRQVSPSNSSNMPQSTPFARQISPASQMPSAPFSRQMSKSHCSAGEAPEEALPSGLLLQQVLQAASRGPPSTAPDPEAQAMKEVCQLRREMMIPLESMQAAMKLFRDNATLPPEGVVFTDGFLTRAKLASVMRQLAGSGNAEIESRWVDSAFRMADQDCDGSISFREFAIWFSSRSFDEDLNLDGKELELRKLSRELEMTSSDLEKYKRHFDSFDTDGNGTMCRDEFSEMMLKCLKIPKHIGLPAARVQQLWSAADSDGSGVIDFTEFAVFFSKYFPQGGACGMDTYYSQNSLLNVLQGTYRAW